jgi:Tol biopolymer transport system component
MPDGANVYFVASDGQAWRLYVQAIANSKPRAITPPLSVRSQAVMEGHMVSPDGRWAFGRDLNHQAWLYPLNGGEPRSARLAPEDVWINWSADGQSGYVYQDEKTHARIFRVDLASGARQLVAEVTPPDTAGLVGITPVRITADGQAFVYSYDRSLSDLFLTEGIQ